LEALRFGFEAGAFGLAFDLGAAFFFSSLSAALDSPAVVFKRLEVRAGEAAGAASTALALRFCFEAGATEVAEVAAAARRELRRIENLQREIQIQRVTLHHRTLTPQRCKPSEWIFELDPRFLVQS
jgi:hypothetical protein